MPKSLVAIVLLVALIGCTNVPQSLDFDTKCAAEVPLKPLARATLRQTGQPLDLAIQGEGYFMAKDEATGRISYTRFGQFHIQGGKLATPDGRLRIEVMKLGQVLSDTTPADAFPADMTRAEVSSDGTISIERPTTSGLQPYGQLKLASFPNREGLKESSPHIYEETCSSGAPMIEPPRAGSTAGVLRVGVLEEEAAAGASDTIGSPRYHVAP